jgi:Bacteriophage protein of unknown function (DUF646).
MSSAGAIVRKRADELIRRIDTESARRAERASGELLTSLNTVLSGSRSGRVYKNHTASAPGEAPANQGGILRASFAPRPKWNGMNGEAGVSSALPYANYLEDGTKRKDGGTKMAPRPYRDKIIEDAKPRIDAIMKAPY